MNDEDSQRLYEDDDENRLRILNYERTALLYENDNDDENEVRRSNFEVRK